jgi:cell fate regulator YaaT (PSP1 superfamily)
VQTDSTPNGEGTENRGATSALVHTEEPAEAAPEAAQAEEITVVGVRFQPGGKIYTFSCGDVEDLIPGDLVVTATSWGRQIGRVVYVQALGAGERRPDLKPVVGRATGADLAQQQYWADKAAEVVEKARQIAAERSLPVKFAAAEYTVDGKRLTLLYESESKESAEEVQKTLSRALQQRVELRQIGPRDVAKIMGGYGACGEERCCSRFLSDFAPISIRMAKVQGVSLTPTEITGMCGRLRCCLSYEHETYMEESKGLPRLKARVNTPYGVGKVVDLLPLKRAVIVQIEDWRVEVAADQIEVLPKEGPKSDK